MGFKFGFIKKIFKGVKKVFKKIGRGIKKVAMGIGKFMNKIGIVGQIALMFIPIPGLGQLLSTMGGWAATALQAMGPIGTSILKGAQFVIGKAGKFVTGAKNIFGTITDGVKTFFGEFTKTALNKIGFDPTKFGFKSAAQGGKFDSWLKTGKGTFGEAWEVVQDNIVTNAGKILDPWKSNIMATSKTTLEGLSDSSYHSVADLKEMNPQITDWNDISGRAINLDPDKVSEVFGVGPLQSTADRALQAQQAQPSLLDKLELKETRTGALTYDPTLQDVGFTPDLSTTLKPTGEGPSYLKDIKPEAFDDTFRMKGVDTVSDTGFFNVPRAGDVVKEFGKELAVSTAMDTAKSWIAGDPPEAPQMGYIPDILPAAVTGRTAPLQFDFSMPSGWTDGYGRDSAGMYNGQNTYAAYMQKMMG